MPTWLLQAAAVLAAVLLLVSCAAHLKSTWRYCTAPWRNDHHRFLSLARLAVTALTVPEVWVMFARPELFWPHGMWLLAFQHLLLWSDILTSKLAQIVLPALAGKLNLPAAPLASLNVHELAAAAVPDGALTGGETAVQQVEDA